MDIEELIHQYAENAALHGKYTENGEGSRKINIAHHNIVAAYKKIKEIDPDLRILLPLLNEDNSSIRVWSATHLLNSHESLALEVLEKESKGQGIISLEAEMVIKGWKSGNLKFNF